MLTRAAVIEKVRDLAGVFSQWATDRSVPRVRDATGREGPALTYELGQTVFDVLESLHDPECEDAALELMVAVENFEREWSRIWGRSREIVPEADQTGGGKWQLLWGDVIVEADKPGMRAPMSPKEWQALGLDNMSIARKMCWYREPGHKPDVTRVAEELAGVARHFDPKTWRDPNIERALAPAREAWQRRVARLALLKDDAPPAPRYDPRTAEEIAIDAPGITVDQIAMRQGRPVTDVKRELHEQGIILTRQGMTYRDASDNAAPNIHDECQTLPERIRAMAADGLKAGQIAQALTKALKVTVTSQKVTKILQGAEAAA